MCSVRQQTYEHLTADREALLGFAISNASTRLVSVGLSKWVQCFSDGIFVPANRSSRGIGYVSGITDLDSAILDPAPANHTPQAKHAHTQPARRYQRGSSVPQAWPRMRADIGAPPQSPQGQGIPASAQSAAA
jgi:hypothetical protein